MDDNQELSEQHSQKAPSFFEKLIDPSHSNTPYPINLIVILIVLILVGLILLIFPFVQTIRTTPKETTQASATISPSATPNPTAGWKTYALKTIPVSIMAPSILDSLGVLEENTEKTTIGERMCGGFTIGILGQSSKTTGCNFSSDSPLLFGTTSTSYETSSPSFLDLQGFIRLNGKYYARIPGNKTLEIPKDLVSEAKNNNGIEIIKIIGSDTVKIAPKKGFVGAIANISIPNSNYTGIVLQVKSDYLEGEGTSFFDQILATVKIQ